MKNLELLKILTNDDLGLLFNENQLQKIQIYKDFKINDKVWISANASFQYLEKGEIVAINENEEYEVRFYKNATWFTKKFRVHELQKYPQEGDTVVFIGDKNTSKIGIIKNNYHYLSDVIHVKMTTKETILCPFYSLYVLKKV